MPDVTRWPETWIAAFGFVLHFLWEFVACPFLYEGMPDLSHASGIAMGVHATLGDVNILLVAFWLVALVSPAGRRWILSARRSEAIAFVAVGITITIVYELVATRTWGRWTYSARMPVVLGVGLAPLAQWLILPPLVLALARKQLGGSSGRDELMRAIPSILTATCVALFMMLIVMLVTAAPVPRWLLALVVAACATCLAVAARLARKAKSGGLP